MNGEDRKEPPAMNGEDRKGSPAMNGEVWKGWGARCELRHDNCSPQAIKRVSRG